MKKIEKLPLIILGICIWFAACKKKDDITNNQTETPPNTTTPTTNTTTNPSTNTTTNPVKSSNMTISANNNFVSIVLPSSSYKYWVNNSLGGFTNVDSVKRHVTQNIYSTFKDNFDFIFIINNENETNNAVKQPSGVNMSVSNSVTGIGRNVYNNGSTYGTSKLISFMWLTFKDGLVNGPTLHEICHNWANHAPKSMFKMLDFATLMDKDHDSHWGFSDVGGQLGGFDRSTFQQLAANKYHGHIANSNSFGLNANYGNSIPYADLELYLMGFKAKEDVPSVRAFFGVNKTNNNDFSEWGSSGNFYATEMKTYTINDIITSLGGERIPNHQNSKKEFRAIVVVLSDRALTAQEATSYDDQVKRFFNKGSDGDSYSYNFWEATKQLGFIKANELNLEKK